MAAHSGGNGRGSHSAWSRLGRRLRVTVGCEDAGHETERIRATTLATLVAAGFLLLGALPSSGPAEWLGESPVNADVAMRTVSLGWFEPSGTLPVTLVDIDEQTWRGWNSPAVTPRRELVKLLQAVTAAAPAALVVDIDLSWGKAHDTEASSEDAGDRELRDFLADYAGPPVVFPKRIESRESAPPRMASSPFDDVIAANPHLSWAHASFQTDTHGKVRVWRDWLAVCADGGGLWLPSVATAVEAVMEPAPAGTESPRPPGSADWDCAASSDVEGGAEQRLLLGPRLSGHAARTIGSGARSVSAALLLDPEVARDDRGLFADRVVLVGATHESSGDLWLTTAGVMPGVELLANAVRYSALQARLASGSGEALRRLAAVALFLLYAAIDWRWRSLMRTLAAVAVTVLYVSVAIGLFDDLRAFEVIAGAVAMTIVYKALETVFEFWVELRTERARFPPGWRSWPRAGWKILCAKMRRRHATAPGDSHVQH